MQAKDNKNGMCQLNIPNVIKRDKDAIDNIADNLGITTASFIKMELKKIINSYPEHMRQKPKY